MGLPETRLGVEAEDAGSACRQPREGRLTGEGLVLLLLTQLLELNAKSCAHVQVLGKIVSNIATSSTKCLIIHFLQEKYVGFYMLQRLHDFGIARSAVDVPRDDTKGDGVNLFLRSYDSRLIERTGKFRRRLWLKKSRQESQYEGKAEKARSALERVFTYRRS